MNFNIFNFILRYKESSPVYLNSGTEKDFVTIYNIFRNHPIISTKWLENINYTAGTYTEVMIAMNPTYYCDGGVPYIDMLDNSIMKRNLMWVYLGDCCAKFIVTKPEVDDLVLEDCEGTEFRAYMYAGEPVAQAYKKFCTIFYDYRV